MLITVPLFLAFDAAGSARGWFASDPQPNSFIFPPGVPRASGCVSGGDRGDRKYAYRVAGTVGRLLAAILGAPPEADQAARALGIAMQRTNILRDIDEDLARRRVYLAAETLQRLGIQDLAQGERRPLLEDQIRVTEYWYRIGITGSSQLRRGRPGVLAAALMYRQILTQIGSDGFGRTRPWRSHVSRRRKAWLALLSLRA